MTEIPDSPWRVRCQRCGVVHAGPCDPPQVAIEAIDEVLMLRRIVRAVVRANDTDEGAVGEVASALDDNHAALLVDVLARCNNRAHNLT